MELASALPNQIKLPAAVKAAKSWKSISRPERHRKSSLLGWDRNRKFLPALGTTTSENSLAVLGLHPLTKAVGAFSFNPARLIGALAHVTNSLLTLFKPLRIFSKAYL